MKTHATPSLLKRWLRSIQVEFLSSLSEHSSGIGEAVIVHGGTALSLAWEGLRHSEDVDMLFDERLIAELPDIVADMAPRINARVKAEIPDFHVDMRMKLSGRKLQCFHLVGSATNVLGAAKVKLEFWPVSPGYLNTYRSDASCFCSRLARPLKVATLESIYYDKLLALTLREFVKHRDIFDAWWISTSCSLPKMDAPCFGRFVTQSQAYDVSTLFSKNGGGLLVSDDLDIDELARQTREDMQKWLHPESFSRYDIEDFKEMVRHVRNACKTIHDAIDPPVLEALRVSATSQAKGPESDESPARFELGEEGRLLVHANRL